MNAAASEQSQQAASANPLLPGSRASALMRTPLPACSSADARVGRPLFVLDQ